MDELLPTCLEYKRLLEKYVRHTGTPIEAAREIVGLWTNAEWKKWTEGL